MGALVNAVTLRADPVWKEWLVTAAAYQARVVMLEDPATAEHTVRLALARDVAVTPQMIADLLVTLISTDPEVAQKGSTPELITEATTLSKVAAAWTTIARLLHPDMGVAPPQ